MSRRVASLVNVLLHKNEEEEDEINKILLIINKNNFYKANLAGLVIKLDLDLSIHVIPVVKTVII